MAELFFLMASIRANVIDYGEECDKNIHASFEVPKITVALRLMIFLHSLHVCRLVYKLLDKLRKAKKRFKGQGLIKCMIMDCYCCAGSSVYIYTQYVFWSFHGDCKKILPTTERWMKVEIIY